MTVDLEEAIRQCKRFIEEMEDNREGYDDAGIARRILEALERGEMPSGRDRRILTHWIHTDNPVFRRGAPIATRIGLAIYGQHLSRED
jgi:hypothetical protein